LSSKHVDGEVAMRQLLRALVAVLLALCVPVAVIQANPEATAKVSLVLRSVLHLNVSQFSIPFEPELLPASIDRVASVCRPRLACVTAFKRDSATAESVAAGDTITYTVEITNITGRTLVGVSYRGLLDPHTQLRPGSVTTSHGAVSPEADSGQSAAVAVVIGAIGAGEMVTISFEAAIEDPLSPGITCLTSQGAVSGSHFDTVLTDDPDTVVLSDPTSTPVAAAGGAAALSCGVAEGLVAQQADGFEGVNGDGLADTPETIRYAVELHNTGSDVLMDVTYTDLLDPHTALVLGSVTTTAGQVQPWEAGGLRVSIGTMEPGETAAISFLVRARHGWPGGVTRLANQGMVSGSNFRTVVTDDPATRVAADPTVTLLGCPCDRQPLPDIWPELAGMLEPPAIARVLVEEGRVLADHWALFDLGFLRDWTIDGAVLGGRPDLLVVGGVGIRVVSLTRFRTIVQLSGAYRNGLADPDLLEAEPLLLQPERGLGCSVFARIPSDGPQEMMVLDAVDGGSGVRDEGYGCWLLADPNRFGECRAGERLDFVISFIVEDVTSL